MNKKKKKSFSVNPLLLLGAAGILLLGSAVGSTRAALTYYSDNYTAQVNMSNIGVTLQENGNPVGTGEQLLTDNFLGGDSTIVPGKIYDESITVNNSGDIESFVRVIVTKSWVDAGGNKDTNLSPELIDLQLTNTDQWLRRDSDTTRERMVFYYRDLLSAGETTSELLNGIRIDGEITKYVKKVDPNSNIIEYTYLYDGYTFNIEVEVDAVQTHSAAEAIKSAWGVDVTVADDGQSISLQ